jgi:uncharacterized protein
MIEIQDLSEKEIAALLERVGYAHLACCVDDRPYLVPVHYVYDDRFIYIYTTEGKKFDIIRANPNVCLQVEEVTDNHHWQSVIVEGIARELAAGARDRAMKLILAANPTLTPALSVRWMDAWVRENIEVVYRITPHATSGRRTLERGGSAFVVTGRDKRAVI